MEAEGEDGIEEKAKKLILLMFYYLSIFSDILAHIDPLLNSVEHDAQRSKTFYELFKRTQK